MNYTPEQLDNLIKNMTFININAIDVLKALKDQSISQSEMYEKAKVSKFVGDKCIAAFLLAGLIEMQLTGLNRIYRITEDGIKLLDYEEGK